jgi:hypothetical protein
LFIVILISISIGSVQCVSIINVLCGHKAPHLQKAHSQRSK